MVPLLTDLVSLESEKLTSTFRPGVFLPQGLCIGRFFYLLPSDVTLHFLKSPLNCPE